MSSKKVQIPFSKTFLAGDELHYIADCITENEHTSGNGLFTKKSEEWLERELGSEKALLTHSCTAALEMVALLTDIAPGDEVIMPSFTYVSTANAFALRGAVPVFVDIRPEDLNIDPRLIASAVTDKTRGIVPVHYAGIPADMSQITAIAHDHGLWVAEDTAHGLLAQYDGHYLGTLGGFGCMSFHESKTISCGEGGALLINDPKYLEKAQIIREKGTDRELFLSGVVDSYSWVGLGSSYVPSEISAVFLFGQLERAKTIVAQRCRIAHHYTEKLEPLQDQCLVRLPCVQDRHAWNANVYYIITRSMEERSLLIDYLAKHGVESRFHFVPLHSSNGGRRYGRVAGSMRFTEDLSGRLLRLPLYHGMSVDEVDLVAEVLTAFYSADLRKSTSAL